ncbi:hypothetical protein MPLDJ20_110329 [Mesorhizobium plurifarium]|uniref:Uncharacterized protein n=1 Tax=Mesorhizobium plurifarium TaxID=69974 RepID=A0A090DUM5_MESPL|nr:hypothetical protein MPLDJ20_110329 [Mesorhizobium plurifarium]CDX62375.1 hypothetical protein MPL3365_70429 [Mesorhizobium plurifarium]
MRKNKGIERFAVSVNGGTHQALSKADVTSIISESLANVRIKRYLSTIDLVERTLFSRQSARRYSLSISKNTAFGQVAKRR